MLNYQIDDLFQSVNDIYAQYDEGEIDRNEANRILIRCCFAFLNTNENYQAKEIQNA